MAILALLTLFSIFGTALAETALPAAAPSPAPPIAAVLSEGGEADGSLRVLLQSLGSRQALGLTLTGPYSVDGDRGFQFAAGTDIRLGLSGGSIVLRVGGAAIDMGSAFTLRRHLGEDGSAGGAYIHESEKDTLYCGDLAFAARNGSLRVILTITVEDYLYGVVPYEMSDAFPLAALRAQAVAARTYAMQRKARGGDKEYDVVDTTNDQVFKGLDARFQNAVRAVDETRGVVGLYAGKYAEMFYAASNGGQTALASDVWGRGDFAFLDIRDDPYDLANPESVVKTASVPKDATAMNPALYEALLEGVMARLRADKTLREGEAVGLATVVSIEAINPLYGGGSRQFGTLRFTLLVNVRRFLPQEGAEAPKLGEVETLETPFVVDMPFYAQARSLLNITINPSNAELVEVTEGENSFTVTARRFGHGVGMSQRGAQRMAGHYGMDYLEILAFYYPGLALSRMTGIETPLTRPDELPESLGYAAARPTPVPTSAPLPALAPGEYYAVVSVAGIDSTLNVREAPSLTDRIIGVLRNGARMIILEELPDGWARMKTAEITGYVSTTFILPEAQGAAQGAAPDATQTEIPEATPHVF